MSIKAGAVVLAAAIMIAACMAWFLRPGPELKSAEPLPDVERTRDQLALRDGLLYEREATEPFMGLLIESYPGGGRKVTIGIQHGKPHGLSRGWFANGQMEVEEHFVHGVAHGLRTRWYENGRKRSQAQIENGQLAGTFIQWHENGRKAAEATMVDGKPDGVARGWHRSGAPKSRVELRGGEVVSREYWDDEVN